MAKIIDLQIDDARWQRMHQLDTRLDKAAKATKDMLPAKLRFPFIVTLVLSNDKTVRRLNRDFRGQDKPTNVLSFPQFEPAQLPKKGRAKEPVELGDIILGYQYIVVEARKDHKMLINHVTHLFIHGLLHLFGYDHISDKDANPMEQLEKKIMARLKLPDPYQISVPVYSKAKKTKAHRQSSRRATTV